MHGTEEAEEKMTQQARVCGYLLLVLSVLVSGCTTIPGLEPPEVSLVNLKFVEATLFETTLDVTVRVTNTNPEPFIVDGSVIGVVVDGVKIGKGTSPNQFEVPRLESATDTLRIHVNNLKLATRLKEIFEQRVITWGINGKLYIMKGQRRVRLPVRSDGRLSLEGDSPDLEMNIAPDEESESR